jgi:hypothetical protein
MLVWQIHFGIRPQSLRPAFLYCTVTDRLCGRLYVKVNSGKELVYRNGKDQPLSLPCSHGGSGRQVSKGTAAKLVKRIAAQLGREVWVKRGHLSADDNCR